MKLVQSVSEFTTFRDQARGSIGFVPTMGALHNGHLSLVQQSIEDNDFTAASIFVNPTQFNDPNDFAGYPNTTDQDLASLANLEVDVVFMPRADEIYSDDKRYVISESQLSNNFCGAHRTGHFDGVLTVVMKLLNIVKPNTAYFGQKDYQQLKLVEGMVAAFHMDIEIKSCPTVRESDGLAMSSRNLRLTPEQRLLAPSLYNIISSAESTDEAIAKLNSLGFSVDYVEDWDGRRLAAATLGDVRLIDNVNLGV